MIKYYSFNEITKNDLDNLKPIRKNHKFLYESLNSEIKYYKCEDSSIEYINFFDKVYFEIKKFDNKPTVYDFFACQIYKDEKSDDTNILDVDISRKLRNSDTLIINNINRYNATHLKVVFSEVGFAFIAKKYNEQQEMFEKNYILFLLAHSYNLYTEKLIKETSSCYKKRDLGRMIDLRKEIYIFDLNCFFINPVNYQKQQLHSLWNYLEKNYLVQQNHKEMKSQVKDLVNLIELQNKEEEDRKYRELKGERQREKEEEDKKYRERKEEEDRKYRERNDEWQKEKEEEDRRYRERKVEWQKEREDEDRKYRERKEEEDIKYRKRQDKKEKEKEIENKKNSTRTFILTFIGVLFAAFSIGSVYADLVELGALSNIFSSK